VKRKIIRETKRARYPTTKITKAAITCSSSKLETGKVAISDLVGGCVLGPHIGDLFLPKCADASSIPEEYCEDIRLVAGTQKVCPVVYTFAL
jgi:hypothetical protein